LRRRISGAKALSVSLRPCIAAPLSIDVSCNWRARWCAARASFERALAIDPNCPEARYNRALLDLGYTDAFRSLHPGEGGQFTYWDYFRKAFEHNRGVRIDHFLLSPPLAERLTGCEIDRAPRAQEKPSDHTPIIVELQ